MILRYLTLISLLMASFSGQRYAPKVRFTDSRYLPNFPSGSSVTYHDEKLYLIGDDANHILILNRQYQVLDSIKLFDHPEKRIPKQTKADLETATFYTTGDKTSLIIMGSASTSTREVVEIIPFNAGPHSDLRRTLNTRDFIKKVKENIADINIEGLTVTNENSILASRANLNNPTNHLIISPLEFWADIKAVIRIAKVRFPIDTKDVIGISELHYDKENDRLLLTCSTELTSDTYDDGEIGDSYLGWINHFSSRQNESEIDVDHLINLSNVHPTFTGEKVEGLCIESYRKSVYTIHLTSDDDLGSTRMFRITLKI